MISALRSISQDSTIESIKKDYFEGLQSPLKTMFSPEAEFTYRTKNFKNTKKTLSTTFEKPKYFIQHNKVFLTIDMIIKLGDESIVLTSAESEYYYDCWNLDLYKYSVNNIIIDQIKKYLFHAIEIDLYFCIFKCLM